MKTNEQWQWQEEGTAWKGVGIYHVTLTVPSREPLLGKLVIPNNDPRQARIERTKLGNAVVDELYVMCRHYPVIRILQFCLMPDHLHAVIRVTQVMETSIRSVIRGYWQGVKKLGRAYTLAARRGVVMVSPFISPKERAVQDVLLRERHPFIVLADNGFRDYYKPSDNLFDAVADGRVLILSPWPYEANKRHISRADCVALNAMAEEIAAINN